MKGFLKTQKFLVLFFIQMVLFSFINSVIEPGHEETIKIEGKSKVTIACGTDNYVEIDINGESECNYFVSVYDDENTNSERIQLVQSYNGIAKLALSKNECVDKQIYIIIESFSNSQKQEFEVKINTTSSDSINLKEGKPFSYFVNEKNTEMKFSLSTKTQYANIWARGNLDVSTSLNCYAKKKESDSYYIVEESLNNNILTVFGKPGDYINVGYAGYENNNVSTSELKVEGPSMTGYLKKEVLEEICYEIKSEKDSIYGTGIILNRIGYLYFKEKDGNKHNETITTGIISHKLPENINNICFSFPQNDKFSNVNEIVFIYQLTKGEIQNVAPNLYEPQLNGILYPRVLKKGLKAVFIPQNNGDFDKMTYDLISLDGFSKMYSYNCDNFPNCNLEDDILLSDKTTRLRNINRFSSFSFNNSNSFSKSPISEQQTLFIVECKESNRDGICIFNTLTFKNDDTIQLIEDQFFNQYAVEKQEDKYKIKLSNENDIQKVFIDVLIYVGDIGISDNSEELGITSDIYYAANKIFISVKNNKKIINEDLIIKVTAKANTYYTVLFNFGNSDNSNEDSLLTNELQSGMSYLVTIDPTKVDKYNIANKILKFRNERVNEEKPFMVNFYSLNCKVEGGEIEKGLAPIYNFLEVQFEHFLFDIVDKKRSSYEKGEYEYRINITESDSSEYEGKLCKIYASAIEVSDMHEESLRDILIPDNTPQQAMFRKGLVEHISYGYIHVDFENDLLIKFNPKHIAKYKITFYFENEKRKTNEIIVANDILILNKKEWEERCKDKNRVCYIQMDIDLLDTANDENKPVLEFSIKSIATQSVAYIPKNDLKFDYVQNNAPQYYYTELGEREEGFIIPNFLRGSGKVCARIVSINLDEPEDGADWRGKYKLPTEEEYCTMDSFTKKLKFTTIEKDCEKGCYLLMKVISDVKSNRVPINRNYPYSLIIHSYPTERTSSNIPKINVPIDEYIVGTVEALSNERIHQFYTVWINSDANYVVIDFQSNAGGIFINVGEEKPTIEAHFPFMPYGQDTTYSISKTQILDIYNKGKSSKKNSLKDIVLTIGIWANMTDSIFTTPFAFIIRLQNEDVNDIYRVNSDHKALCKTKKFDNDNYRCVYVIEYDFITRYSNLILYPTVQDKSVLFDIYAKYVNSVDFEMNKFSEAIKSEIPNDQNKDFTNELEETDYIYIDDSLPNDKYLLVSIETNENTIVELLSTFALFQDESTPNPYSPQLYTAIKDMSITLNFGEDYMIMANLIGVGGQAEMFWTTDKDNKFYLKGRDDRISITSTKSNDEHKLKIISNSDIKEGIGFIFYVDYNIRVDNANFDLLNFDKTVKYTYLNNDLPIIYYSPLNNIEPTTEDDYYDIFFSFIELINEDEKERTFYQYIPFKITGKIVNESLIYETKLNPQLTIKGGNTFYGYYDQSMRAGIIRLYKDFVTSSYIPTYEKPYLYLKVDKSDEFKDIRKYKKIELETTAVLKNSNAVISEASYQFGFFDYNETQRTYMLLSYSDKKYMNIEFSCVDNNIEIQLEDKYKDELIFKKSIYGIKYYSIVLKNVKNDKFKIKLIVNKKVSDSFIEFFTFRYNYTDSEYNNNYEIEDTTLDVIENKNSDGTSNFIVSLAPVKIKNEQKINITYIVRAIKNEEPPKNPDITIKIATQNTKEFYNPTLQDNKLKFELTDIEHAVSYIQVVAQIQEEEKIDYLSYDYKRIIQKKSDDDDDDDNNKGALTAAIVIGVFLFIIVVILVVVIIMFNSKNKDLMEKVNKISFADNDGKGDDDLLLEKETKN